MADPRPCNFCRLYAPSDPDYRFCPYCGSAYNPSRTQAPPAKVVLAELTPPTELDVADATWPDPGAQHIDGSELALPEHDDG